MCPTCNNLKIIEISLELYDGKRITLNSNEYDIGFYMSKTKISGISTSNVPWKLKYEIIINGKFDRDKINSFEFGSQEMIDELNVQKNTKEYNDSCIKLKDIFWGKNMEYLIKYNNNIEFTLSNGKTHKISAIINSDRYPNIPKIKFNRTEDNIIE